MMGFVLRTIIWCQFVYWNDLYIQGRPMPPMKPKPGLPTGAKPTPVPRRSTASDSGETGKCDLWPYFPMNIKLRVLVLCGMFGVEPVQTYNESSCYCHFEVLNKKKQIRKQKKKKKELVLTNT